MMQEMTFQTLFPQQIPSFSISGLQIKNNKKNPVMNPPKCPQLSIIGFVMEEDKLKSKMIKIKNKL